MVCVAFAVSGVLEVVGLLLVGLDVRRERNTARRLLNVPVAERVTLDESNMRDYPGSSTVRQGQVQQDADIAHALATAELAREALLDFVSPGWTRLIGPTLIGVGIVIGTVANIWAL